MATWTADDGTEINFELHGAGTKRDALLLLPGLLGSVSSQWHSFLRPLSADFRLVLMDLRGHGRSTNQASSLSPDDMVQDIAGLLSHLQISAINVAGYDLGGYLGLLLALNNPNLVKTLLMHATKFYWTRDGAAKMREQLDPNRMATKVPTYADQLVQEHGARNWRELVRQAADLVGGLAQDGVSEAVLGGTKCPVIVSVGDRDGMVPLPEAQRLSRVIPGGKLLVLPGVSHAFRSVGLIPLLPMMQLFHKGAH
jgi:pimeloyl-ACP methyl ester carboxylesterase